MYRRKSFGIYSTLIMDITCAQSQEQYQFMRLLLTGNGKNIQIKKCEILKKIRAQSHQMKHFMNDCEYLIFLKWNLLNVSFKNYVFTFKVTFHISQVVCITCFLYHIKNTHMNTFLHVNTYIGNNIKYVISHQLLKHHCYFKSKFPIYGWILSWGMWFFFFERKQI